MATYLNFPFDAEIFNYDWKNAPDVVLTSMIESGAVVNDSEIARLISNGSNFFTVPYYNVLGGNEDVYDGATNFTYDSLTGGTYSGVVYGRMKAWDAVSFIKDFNSGADPMAQIVKGVAQYWQKKRQDRLVGLLEAIFGVLGDTDFTDTHILDIASATSTVADENKIGATTISDATVKACGDNAFGFSLAIMHSAVANRLANLQLLEFSKYTDASGIQRPLPLGYVNGMLVVVNDNVPVLPAVAGVNGSEYTTYVLGNGAIRYAQAPVDVPVEMDRNPATNGGMDMIYTRIREALVPYGFSFIGDISADVGVSDTVLLSNTSWVRKMPVKAIKMVKIVTN